MWSIVAISEYFFVGNYNLSWVEDDSRRRNYKTKKQLNIRYVL
jgi:hypothetical protein